jgi:outer membrane protein assembly factor BamB
VNLGEGYAMPAVANGRCYLLDYDHAAQADVLRCLSFADGKELWRYSYPAVVKRNHGMSRTQPAVSGNYVVAIGPLAMVTCADAQSGKVYWQVDLVKQYGTRVPPWYVGQCPLIDGNAAILAPGGQALMVALDLASGKVLWQTPNPQGWQMTHSSIMPMTVEGTKMYVYPASGGVVGVSARDGKLLWQFPGWRVPTANVPSPVPIGDGRVFLCGGYNSGSLMLRIKGSGGNFRAEEVFRLPTSTFGSQQMTPILYNGHLYGVREGGELVCLDLNGKVVWASGPQHRFGIGPYTLANGLLYVMNDTGVLTLVEASPAGYKQLAQAKVLSGGESWGPLVITGGRLLCRDLTRLVCLKVSG